MHPTVDTWLNGQEESRRLREKLLCTYELMLGPGARTALAVRLPPGLSLIRSSTSSGPPGGEDLQTEHYMRPSTHPSFCDGPLSDALSVRRRSGLSAPNRDLPEATDYGSIVSWSDQALGQWPGTGCGYAVVSPRLASDVYRSPRASLRSLLEGTPWESNELEPGFSETVLKTTPVSKGIIRARVVHKGHARPPRLILD